MKKERERSPLSQEDEHTQTSSPGGWHAKLSALNFLHLQVHRRGTATSSRASSRKSSRASDASDLSELAGPWLNLPLMLVGGAGDVLKDIKPLEDDRMYVPLSRCLLLFHSCFFSFSLIAQSFPLLIYKQLGVWIPNTATEELLQFLFATPRCCRRFDRITIGESQSG